ncbi:hypothetical protein V6N13_109441 [Hibiscus sabdariffa]|uniref:Uncharacterized protein n=1 Tax=Hibiscus sabdariffa TaxID=183260 RepID=A0ABR2FPJ3_9ROSI
MVQLGLQTEPILDPHRRRPVILLLLLGSVKSTSALRAMKPKGFRLNTKAQLQTWNGQSLIPASEYPTPRVEPQSHHLGYKPALPSSANNVSACNLFNQTTERCGSCLGNMSCGQYMMSFEFSSPTCTT